MDRQDAVVWALNFAGRDLKGLRKRERHALYEELKRNLFSGSQYKPALTGDLLSPEGLEKIRDALSEFFEKRLLPVLMLSKVTTERPGDVVERLTVEGVKEQRPELWPFYARFGPLGVPALPPAPGFQSRSLYPEGNLLRFDAIPGGTLEEWIVEQVISLLAQAPPLPLTTFQVCEGCNLWFAGRRFRRFCTPACNRRHNVRKARGKPGSKEYEAYLKKQREYMNARYRESMGHPPLRSGK
jgi:hypothetical protein